MSVGQDWCQNHGKMLEKENIPGYQNRSQMCGPEWSGNRWVQQPRALARCKLRKRVPWDWSWMLATVSWSCLRMMIKPELSGMKRIHFEAQACKSKKLTAAWVSWSISIHFQLGSDCQGFQVKLRRSGHQWDYDVRFFGDTMELEICPVHFRDFMFGLSWGTRPW